MYEVEKEDMDCTVYVDPHTCQICAAINEAPRHAQGLQHQCSATKGEATGLTGPPGSGSQYRRGSSSSPYVLATAD
jgi:hypothetical protein